MMRCTVLILISIFLTTASITTFNSTNLMENDEIYFSEGTEESENQTGNESILFPENSSDTSILCFSNPTASTHQYGTCTIENLRNETLYVHINSSNPMVVSINDSLHQIPANGTGSAIVYLNHPISEEENMSNLLSQFTTTLEFEMRWNESNTTATEVQNFTFPMLSFFCMNPSMSILVQEGNSHESRVSGLTSCSISNHLAYNLSLEFTPVEAYFLDESTTVFVNNSNSFSNGDISFDINESIVRAEPYGRYIQHVELNITAIQGNSSTTLEPALIQFTVQHLEPIDPEENPYEGAGSGLAYLFWEIDNVLNRKDTPSTGPCESSEGCEEGSLNQQNTKGSFEELPDNLDWIMLLLLAVMLLFLPGMKKQTNE